MSELRKKPQTFKQKSTAWSQEHLRCFIACLGQFRRSFISTLLTIAVIGIILAVPAGLSLVLSQLSQFTDQLDNSNLISLYLQQESSEGDIQNLIKTLESDHQINTLKYISRDQALKTFQESSDQKEILQMLGENPLPAMLQVTPTQNQSPEALQRLVTKLEKLPVADLVQFDRHWAKRLYSIIQLLDKFDLVLTILLCIAVLLTIGNTIRVNIQSRLQEIQLSRFFGATNAFIRRPFLHAGFLYGILGGFLACFLLLISYSLLSRPVNALISAYQADPTTGSASSTLNTVLTYSLSCVASGALLGVISAWVVVFIYQKDLEKHDYS